MDPGSFPPLTDALADAIEARGVGWGRSWLAGVAGLELAEVADHLLVPCHPERPDLDFQNRVNGLRATDAGLVAGIAAWYTERNVRPWFEIVPHDESDDLLAALHAVGARPIGYHGVVFGPVRADAPPPALPADMVIDVIDPGDEEDFATFCQIRVAGHDLPRAVVEQATADLAGWRTAGDAALILARVGGQPAATAALTVGDGIAYLADAATLPAFRGRGVQRALIEERLARARSAGCHVACSQASLASTSHRNLQRAGLFGGFTKTVWRVAGDGTETDLAR